MKLFITPEAEKQIKQKMKVNHLIVTLKYETEGCGCAVSGIPTLELINQQQVNEEDYVRVATDAMDVYIEKTKLVFFDDEMKIDYLPEKQIFRLSSPSEILNGRMSCQIK
ncbi:iron-sulfur cluster biosynthesis family protein [Bacillus sp. SD088]|uniref:iron-sulfur cluster biosynthesis family protein n=1 Tax=Bacillus sp. SD088 TaxID=2782012 RepID=UPI001A95BBAE|nr:iron-sulfur cluster biosynthesis family protein [Bacillus sp. SD088]MBO0995312.1 iron-sulfur cluster biosynthesis family protein [Bacillus sp. SD088]